MSQWRNRKFKTRSNRQHGSEVILSAVFLFFVFFTNRTLPYIVVTRERIHERTRFRELTYHFSGVHLECAVSLRTNAHLCSYMLYYYHVTLFNVTLTIFHRASFLDQGRFFCRMIEDEGTKISQIQTVTYLSSPELFVLLWVEGWYPAMKRNLFYREILPNARLHRNRSSDAIAIASKLRSIVKLLWRKYEHLCGRCGSFAIEITAAAFIDDRP